MNNGTVDDKLFSSPGGGDQLFSKKKKEKGMFATETTGTAEVKKKWKILVVDDVMDVHASTHIILDDFSFGDRKVQIFDAYSAKEAKRILENEMDIALIFLDVVMETNDAGLKLVDYCRNELKNSFTRIVLRTGQPGDAPERTVINDYDINDYWTKVELTSSKMMTVVTSELRTYKLMITVEYFRQNLEQKVRDRTQELQAKKEELQVLLDKTLKGSISVLLEILAVINPKEFSNSSRYRIMAKKIIQKIKPEKMFETEIASILSQIGCVAVPDRILEKKNKGEELLPEEEKLFNTHPDIGEKLLKKIPRMEEIAEIIGNQMTSSEPDILGEEKKDIILISGILRIVRDYDEYIRKGLTKGDAWNKIMGKRLEYHQDVFDIMRSVVNETEIGHSKISVTTEELVIGSNLAEDIHDNYGLLVVGKGNEISEALYARLNNYKKMRLISEPIEILVRKD